MKKTVLVAGAVVLAVTAGAALLLRSPSTTGNIPTLEIELTSFRQRVTAEGNLMAVESTPLTAPIRSRQPQRIAWMVDDGSRVKKGDVVIRFDPSDFEKDMQNGASDQRVADHRLHKATLERQAQQKNLNRDADLAVKELENARRFRTTDNAFASRMEIVESQIDTELAEHRTEHAEEAKTIQDELSGANIDLIEIERRKANLKIEQAQEGLESLQVTAPHDGIVILDRDWRGNTPKIGETVWPGRSLATLPLLGEMEAEVFVLEADAGGLEPGQKASMWLEAHPEHTFATEVQSVDPVAQRRIRWVPVQYFRVVLKLEKTDPKLMKPGHRVATEIMLADLEEAIAIPRQAVFEQDGQKVVFRRTQRRFEAVEVELGASALGRVVVGSGLEEGDVIALHDPRESTDTESEPDDRTAGPLGGAR